MKLPQSSETSVWRRTGGLVVTMAGAAMAICGVYLIGIYIHGVIQVRDEPDKSLIFWGLAILVMGIMFTVAGGIIFALGRKSFRGPTGKA